MLVTYSFCPLTQQLVVASAAQRFPEVGHCSRDEPSGTTVQPTAIEQACHLLPFFNGAPRVARRCKLARVDDKVVSKRTSQQDRQSAGKVTALHCCGSFCMQWNMKLMTVVLCRVQLMCYRNDPTRIVSDSCRYSAVML